jgi:hypothetical protein
MMHGPTNIKLKSAICLQLGLADILKSFFTQIKLLKEMMSM